MDGRELLCWVSSQLHSASAKDIGKDFSDGTVFMELAVLLVKDEAAISEALEHFTECPNTMFQSLENLKSVFKCLGSDGLVITATPLDVFRGRTPPILELLQALYTKYSALPQSKSSLSREDITKWTKSVREHTEHKDIREEQVTPVSEHHSQLSDHDTGFIDLTASDEETEKGEPVQRTSLDKEERTSLHTPSSPSLHVAKYSALPPESTDTSEEFVNEELPEPRPHDESYTSIDIIEVEEYLVRADTKITLTSGSTQRACVFVSVPMRSKVTDHAARQSFIQQAVKNYCLQGCEASSKELAVLQLGYTMLLATCSYSRSLRTGSVGIYSPFLLGLCTINISDKRQLFAHTMRGRLTFTALAKQGCVKLTLTNISKHRVSVILPEGSVFEQQDYNGDSHLVTTEPIIRTLDCEETEIINISCLYLNKHAGGARSQRLNLTPFVFRGPVSDQEKLLGYSDPGLDGHFRFCNSCHQAVMRASYGVLYYTDRPYHLGCGPVCAKCGLVCLCLTLNTDKPYCSLECQYLSTYNTLCNKCGYVTTGGPAHARCPKKCKVCDVPCYEEGTFCSQLCQDWDTSKNAVCQGCAQPITSRANMTVLEGMTFHSAECVQLRQSAPPLILQRAMVRGRDREVKELRRLSKMEFEKRSQRRREALKQDNEQKEQVLVLDGVMACINNIEANTDHTPNLKAKKSTARSTDPLAAWNKSLMSVPRTSEDPRGRKRSNVKQPQGDSDSLSGQPQVFSRANRNYQSLPKHALTSRRGSFRDLLFCSDEEDESPPAPCLIRRSRKNSASRSITDPAEFEKKKLNRGFPTGTRDQLTGTRDQTRQTLNRSMSDSDTNVVTLQRPPNKSSSRFNSLRRNQSSTSYSSTKGSSSPSKSPTKVEFERPNLFEQLRMERVMHEDSSAQRVNRHKSAPEPRRDVGPGEERRASDWEKRKPKHSDFARSVSSRGQSYQAEQRMRISSSSSSSHYRGSERQRSGSSSSNNRVSPSGMSQRVSPSGEYQKAMSTGDSPNRTLSPPGPDYQRRTPSPIERGDYQRAISPIDRVVTPDQMHQQKSPPRKKPSPKAILEFDPISSMDFPRPAQKPSNPRSRSRSIAVVGKTSLSPDPFSSLRRSASEENSDRALDLLSLQGACNENKYSLDLITDSAPGSWNGTLRLGNNNVENHNTVQGPLQGSGDISVSEVMPKCLSISRGQSRESLRSRPVGPNSMTLEQSNVFSNTITMPGSRECLQSRPVPTVALRLAKDSNSQEDIARTDFIGSHFKRLSAQTVV